MTEPISFGNLDFNLVDSKGETLEAEESEKPFHMLVMGDFSGRASRNLNRSCHALTDLKPLQVDRDNVDILMANLGVEIYLPMPGENAPPMCISFSKLDDFHPDSLYRRLPVFQTLKGTKRRLKDPSAFAAVAKDLVKVLSPEKENPFPEPVEEQPSGDLLNQVIEKSRFKDRQTCPEKSETRWDVFLHTIIKPHLVPKAHPRQEELIDAVDAAASELMQTILHHKGFQAMEAAWQGLYFIVSRLEMDSRLTLSLLDISKTELESDLFATKDLRSTALYNQWVEQVVGTAGQQPWAVVAGNYTFEKQDKDIILLGRMAKIAAAAGTCFVAAAGDRFLCKSSLADTPDPHDWEPREDQGVEDKWQTLRHLPEAVHIGLALPRMLLRLPYGADTNPIDAFPFEEMPIPLVHNNYLWGNPCLALILLLCQTFGPQSRHIRPGSILEINSLPLHVYRKDGESYLKPCAETLLSQLAAEQIMDKGLMPILSCFNQDMVRLERFQSIAEPPTPVAGPW